MAIKPPFSALHIPKAPFEFYEGYRLPIALVSKISMTLLVLWALVWPGNANTVLSAVNGSLLNGVNRFYIIPLGVFAFFLFVLAVLSATGRLKLVTQNVAPEFSNFSWFSMMFGAGLGVGLMVFATAEPLGL